MNRLKKHANGTVKFDEYFNYLKSVSDKIPGEMYNFFKEWKHYSLDDRESLHDCWVENISIAESSDGSPEKNRNVNVSIFLLGAYHDRRITLNYHDVSNYNLSGCELCSGAHGDIVVHELNIEDDSFSHEFLFSSEAKIKIYFKRFSYTICMIK